MTGTRLDSAALEPYIVGMVDLERAGGAVTPLRLPLRIHPSFPNTSLARLVRLPMGVRLRMLTAAHRLEIDARVEQHVSDASPASIPRALWIATRGDGPERQTIARVEATGVDRLIESLDGHVSVSPGSQESAIFSFDDRPTEPRIVEIWLPHNARIDLRSIAADEPILLPPSSSRLRWAHYGSSISQCVEADDPLSSWPQQTAHALGVDFTSLAFAGNAMLDPFVAQVVADIEVDVVTVKVGINIVNAAAMTARTFGPALHGFLDRIRERHTRVPIIVISAIACPMHEDTPGPTVWRDDGTLGGTTSHPPREDELTLADTRRIVRSVADLRAAAGESMLHLDGLELFGPADVDLLSDGLHPTQQGFDVMAGRFVDVIRSREDLSAAFHQNLPSAS
ncbi:MAG TPA: GDSL-type esterase/lipase family protein [Plantibacter sp.]|uniref:GDSL-type esterase/lipase family protein n=1 Tax=unclassified Plantibacter TaxID=2624265 RepID=UPI002C1FD788|nr:GDSL-type esterase/lipase family protein [Plantibacter sp.]